VTGNETPKLGDFRSQPPNYGAAFTRTSCRRPVLVPAGGLETALTEARRRNCRGAAAAPSLRNRTAAPGARSAPAGWPPAAAS
jgi:hypothetical protein